MSRAVASGLRLARSLAPLLLCACLQRADPADPSARVGAHLGDGGSCGRLAAGIRLVTFNVHGQDASTIANAFRSHRQLRHAQVILLQEIEHRGGRDTTAALARELGMAYAYAPGYGLPAGGSHGVAILSRCPLGDVGILELPRYDVHMNAARRVALGATAQFLDQPLRVYSVHLDNRINPGQRKRQLAPVLDDIGRRPAAPVVVGGDFNTSPFCWLWNLLPVPCGVQGSRLERYVRERGLQTPVTDSGGTSKWLAMRLDGFYTGHVQISGHGVADAVRLSDHLPLWMDVRRRLDHRSP